MRKRKKNGVAQVTNNEVTNNATAISLFRKTILKALLGVIALLAGLWFLIFGWDWNRWPKYAMEELRCYSPNGEYYVVRFQSLANRIFYPRQDHVYGTAKLYNKDGKFLYSEKTILGSEYGPQWFGNSVAYFGTSPEWYFKPPTTTGVQEATGIGECYNSSGELLVD